MRKDNENFYTFRGYNIKNEKLLSASMEDYLEMIFRLSENSIHVRVNDLSEALNVQPPSTTKMIKKLSDMNLANYEKYSYITLTDKGREIGNYLLNRHNTIIKFLETIGVKENLLEQTEKIEHSINEETLERIKGLIDFLAINPDLITTYNNFIEKNNL